MNDEITSSRLIYVYFESSKKIIKRLHKKKERKKEAGLEIMQNIAAPPRARIGGLCLPLNSRKPPARRGSRQVRPGEGLAVGLGRVLDACWVSVSPSGEWGGTVDSVGGLRSTGTAHLSASPTWKPLPFSEKRH